MRLNCLLFILLPCAMAQPGISTPDLGYVYDPVVSGIRAIRGVPGAALMTEPIDFGFPIAAATISPTHDFALTVAAASGEVSVVRWKTGTKISPLPGSMDAPDQFLFSPSGSAAALRKSGRLQLVLGLPDAPVLRELDSAEGAIAVGDDGSLALSTSDGVRIAAPAGDSFSLPLPRAATLAFDPSTRHLLAVTHTGEMYLASNIQAGADVRRIANGTAIAEAPVAARFSADGSTAHVASESGAVVSLDLTNGTAGVISCACVPTGLYPLRHTGLFRLTDFSDGPLWLLDTSRGRVRVWFVPAVGRRSAL